MLVGYFNEILFPSEVKGGNFCNARAMNFGSMIDDCDLNDMGFKGLAHTWHRSVNSCHRISKRLDRALVDCDWRITFPEVTCTHLHRMFFDHNPLLLRLQHFVPRASPRPFRFEAAWVSHPDFNTLVQITWTVGEGRCSEIFSIGKDYYERSHRDPGSIGNN